MKDDITAGSAPEQPSRVRVGITDDHQMVREGLRAFLSYARDIEIVFLASNGSEALDATNQFSPDVVLMDLVMPGDIDGIEAIRQIHIAEPSVAVIALTSFQEPERILGALEAGAIGYLQKDVNPSDLLSAIRQAAAGRSVLEPAAFAALQSLAMKPKLGGTQLPYEGTGQDARHGSGNTHHADSNSERATTSQEPGQVGGNSGAYYEALTSREQEVLQALASGRSNKEIATELGISEKTVKVHVSHILSKLGVYDRTQALLAAAKLGLIQLG